MTYTRRLTNPAAMAMRRVIRSTGFSMVGKKPGRWTALLPQMVGDYNDRKAGTLFEDRTPQIYVIFTKCAGRIFDVRVQGAARSFRSAAASTYQGTSSRATPAWRIEEMHIAPFAERPLRSGDVG
jgi:hypothetical protein